jgi:putative membrane protein
MQNFSIIRLLRDAAMLAFGTLVAAWLVTDITYADSSTLLLVALFLGIVNLLIKPLLILFALPFVVLTLGLGVWLINAALLYLAGVIITGFTVPTYGAALWGSLIISLCGMAVNLFLAPRPRVRWNVTVESPANRIRRRRRSLRDDDVIDV